ncbi:MAG: Uma2 family endonuclease [Acidobacteria bacterium]|nr:Uma2 family endonuclease [Acidobacteriota bacterium]
MSTSVNTSPPVKTYTLEEFWQLPDPPDRSKLELIDGVLYVTPPPEETHDDVVARLADILGAHRRARRYRGKIYFPRAAIWTSGRTYLEPDLFYVSDERSTGFTPNHRDSADLVVEVISPGSAVYDRNRKAETYAALGVGELWLIDETERTVEVRRQTGAGTFDEGRTFGRGESVESAVFPGLRLQVERLFTD